MLGIMDSTTKDELKIKEQTDDPFGIKKDLENLKVTRKLIDPSEPLITNYDEMLKEFIEYIDKSCEAILKNLDRENYILAAYDVGLLHNTASNAIEQFGIAHLFKNEADNDN